MPKPRRQIRSLKGSQLVYPLLATLLMSAAGSLAGGEPPRPERPASDAQPSLKPANWTGWLTPRQLPISDAPNGLQRLATDIVLDNLPETYDDRRKWGMTRPRFDGLHVRLDGLQVRTKRKRKEVNHGTWKRYQIRQIDPRKNLQVHISPARTLPDGRTAFRVELASKINAVARLSEWNRGIRLISISIDADADVRITMDCRLDVQLDPSRLPPDVVLAPEVADAVIRVSEFRVNRISHLDGPLARELSSSLESLIKKKIAAKQPKLVRKINRQIEKHRDDLRISMHDAVKEKWNAFVGQTPNDLDADENPLGRNTTPPLEGQKLP